MYNPETFSTVQVFKYKTNYTSSNFNSVNEVISSSGPAPHPLYTTNPSNYQPTFVDVTGALVLGIFLRPLMLPIWLIQGTQNFSSPPTVL